MTEKERETETEVREENAEERETVRNDEDSEERETLRNDERAVVIRDDETEGEEDMKSGKRDKMDEAEDTLCRFEYEIEESVADFEDEIPTERNEIPESSDDSSEDEIDVREKRMKIRSHDKLALGSSYYTLYEFKEVFLEYALSKRRNIKQDRWDKTKVSYVCGIGGKCKWRIYCSYDIESQRWLLKTKYMYHSCTPDGKCKLLKSPVIARLFLDKVRQKADLMPEEIQQIIKEK